MVTSLTGSVGWNLDNGMIKLEPVPSLPSREVWVEIFRVQRRCIHGGVTSLTGSVGWNKRIWRSYNNTKCHFPHGKCGLKLTDAVKDAYWLQSLPSREVWVEIVSSLCMLSVSACHFPHGKCGLKYYTVNCPRLGTASLPSREVWVEIKRQQAWIRRMRRSLPSREVWVEILTVWNLKSQFFVTSLTGSVDWNIVTVIKNEDFDRHFPYRKCGWNKQINSLN